MASIDNGFDLGIEASLFRAADKLRGNMEPSDYKHVALGLIFLKHISDGFELKRQALLVRPGMVEMFKELHVMHQMEHLPPQYRTEEARAQFAATFDDCAIPMLFQWLFGLPDAGTALAAN